MKLSIVTTLYKSAPYIDEFYQRASATAQQLVGESYEIIFVNDGSPDDSLDIAVSVSEKDSRVAVIDLSRNFGQHKAMMTGLSYANGEKIFLLDSDLEESPEWLLLFNDTLEAQHCDVVYGVQEKRKGGLFEQWSGEAYYSFLNYMTGINHPRNIVTARLMTAAYVKALLQHNEREIIISYLWLLTGFTQYEQIVNKLSHSPTTYSLLARIRLAIHGITTFSARPLELVFYLGLIITAFSFFTGLYLIFNKLFFTATLSGWTSFMVSLWFLGGMIISILGVIGLYISKIFSEVKQRPRTIIRKCYDKR